MRKHNGIIANPNCVAIVAATPLWPLHQKRRIKRITMSTYQAASGAGAAAMEELSESTRAYLEGRAFTPKVLPHPYAFNVFSHNTKVDPETGYNEEETKVMQETRKIFGEPDLRVTATCVRVPVLRAHCIALNIEFEVPLSPAEARAILADAPGVRVVDDMEKQLLSDAASTPAARTKCWSAASARMSAIPRVARSRCSSPAISCARARR